MPRRVMRCSATTVWSFLSDTTATYDYADRGFGPMSNADVHASLVMLVASTAHVMWVAEMKVQLAGGHGKEYIFASRLIDCLEHGDQNGQSSRPEEGPATG